MSRKRSWLRVTITIIACASGFWAHGADRQEELFDAWEKALQDLKSLVVEFSKEKFDPVFKTRNKSNGTLRLLRTPNGDFFASFEITDSSEGAKGPVIAVLLNGGRVYLLSPNQKEAFVFDPPDYDFFGLLKSFFKSIKLLDKTFAKKVFDFAVTNEDEWYTYLTMKPKEVMHADFELGRIVLGKKESKNLPKNMPRQLWFRANRPGGEEVTIEINRWLFNAPDAPKLEEFTKPEDRPGWKVYDKSGNEIPQPIKRSLDGK